jgi:glucokinase
LYRGRIGLPEPHPGDAPTVFVAARQGDRACQAIIEETAFFLGLLLVNVIHIFNPQVVILGGGVATSGEALLPGAQQIITRLGIPPLVVGVEIRPSSLGGQAGVYGAGFLASLKVG